MCEKTNELRFYFRTGSNYTGSEVSEQDQDGTFADMRRAVGIVCMVLLIWSDT